MSTLRYLGAMLAILPVFSQPVGFQLKIGEFLWL